jgi:hypothetical protein
MVVAGVVRKARPLQNRERQKKLFVVAVLPRFT